MLIKKARELGVMLSESPEFVRMSRARLAVAENEALSGLLSELANKRERLIACVSGDNADPGQAVTLTGDIERLRGQLGDNRVFAELLAAEDAFSALIASVNTEINACIGSSEGCTHNCSSCGGCAR